MAKLPFLLKHSFSFQNTVKNNQLTVIMTPKFNLWFYMFALLESIKCICNIKKIESEEE